MRFLLPLFSLFSLVAVAGVSSGDAADPEWRDGDIVFQASQSEQSRYIMLATGSRLTHVGLIDVRPDGVYVVEAVQPVKVTPLERFRNRYDDPRLAVKRVPDLSDGERSAVVKEARRWVGRDYDRRFGWSDATLYCSELVWKAFDRAVDRQIVPLGRFGDFMLFDTPVGAEFVERRWGKEGPDPEEQIVSPADLWRGEGSEVLVDQF